MDTVRNRYMDTLGYQARSHARMIREQFWDGLASGRRRLQQQSSGLIPPPSPPATQDFYGLLAKDL